MLFNHCTYDLFDIEGTREVGASSIAEKKRRKTSKPRAWHYGTNCWRVL